MPVSAFERFGTGFSAEDADGAPRTRLKRLLGPPRQAPKGPRRRAAFGSVADTDARFNWEPFEGRGQRLCYVHILLA